MSRRLAGHPHPMAERRRQTRFRRQAERYVSDSQPITSWQQLMYLALTTPTTPTGTATFHYPIRTDRRR